MGIENKTIVLQLNKVWQTLGFYTIKDALIAMNSNSLNNGAMALDIGYSKLNNGEWNFEDPIYINPVKFEEWITLPIRDYDLVIHTPRLTIRAPTVIISLGYNKTPLKRFKANRQSILERDNYTCQYSGRKLTKSSASIDHIIPKARGGANKDPKNLVACHKDINYKKGDKLNSEAGLVLLREPSIPNPLPISVLIKDARHPDHNHFLMK